MAYPCHSNSTLRFVTLQSFLRLAASSNQKLSSIENILLHWRNSAFLHCAAGAIEPQLLVDQASNLLNLPFACLILAENHCKSICYIPSLEMPQQKVVLKLLAMADDKTKQKAIEAVADIYGVDSIAANSKEMKITVIGEMDTVKIAKKLKKIGKVDIVSVGPAKEEKKEEKKK